MSASGSVSITGTVTGLPSGSKSLSGSLSSASPVGTVQEISLASGANTISVPSGATGVLIVPYASNTQTLTLKGVTGDTGFNIHKTNPTWLSLDPGTTSFVITAGGATGGSSEFNWV